jgi:hypothetical protein
MADTDRYIQNGHTSMALRHHELETIPGKYVPIVALWGGNTGASAGAAYWPGIIDNIAPGLQGAGLLVHADIFYRTSSVAGAETWVAKRIARSLPTVVGGTVAAGANLTLFTPTAGKKARFHGCVIGSDVSTSISVLEPAAGILIARAVIAAGTSWNFLPPMWEGYLANGANNAIVVQNTGTASVNLAVTALVSEE